MTILFTIMLDLIWTLGSNYQTNQDTFKLPVCFPDGKTASELCPTISVTSQNHRSYTHTHFVQ